MVLRFDGNCQIDPEGGGHDRGRIVSEGPGCEIRHDRLEHDDCDMGHD
jgi:hypothetical protein